MDLITKDALQNLTERRDALARNLMGRTDEGPESTAADARDLSEVTVDAELRNRLKDREAAELREVEAALARIQDGTYGRCVKCDHSIGRQRLRAVPEAKLCLSCGSARSSSQGADSQATARQK